MSHISLSITDRAPLEFEGKQLVRVESDRDQVTAGLRGYDLTVYSRDAGGFVVAIDFMTTVPGESNQSVVESVDSVADVEDVFFAFEPDELLPHSMKSQLTPTQRQDLLQRLYSKYNLRVREVLKQLHTKVGESKPSASTV